MKQKAKLLAPIFLLFTICSFAQTNTFPTTGNVGVGTTSPTTPLDVAGTVNISGNNEPSILQLDAHGSTSNIAKILFKNSGGTGDFKIAGDGGDVQWQGGGSRQLQMGAYHGIVLLGARATTSDVSFEGGTGTDFNTKIRNTNPASVGLIVNGHGYQYADLQQWSNGDGTPLSVVNANGNFGIGTTSPAYKLDVRGTSGSAIRIMDESGFNYITSGTRTGWGTGPLLSLLGGRLIVDDGSTDGGNSSIIRHAVNELNFYESDHPDYPGNFLVRQKGGNYALQVNQGTNGNILMLSDANNSGNVGIGTTTPQSKLAVNGTITTTKLKVTQTGWADYVFEKNYKLPTLKEVEEFIKRNKHLPGIVSAREVEKEGLDVGENQAALLKKIEEMTLYMIDMKKQLDNQQKKIERLESKGKSE